MSADKFDLKSNPYASPTAVPDEVVITTTGDDINVAALRAFVGRNADSYITKWAPQLSGNGKPGFNFAAFFLSGLWLGYRKMYKAAVTFYSILLAITAGTIALTAIVEAEINSDMLDRAIGFGFAAVCGAFGNRWYLAHANRAIREARAEGLEGEQLLRELSRRGGTNLWASLGLFVLYVAAIFVLAMAEEFFILGTLE